MKNAAKVVLFYYTHNIGGEIMRRENPFPLKGKVDRELCAFIATAWENGWFDEYSDDHFLIKAIEGRLTSFVGIDQMIENNINYQGIVDEDGNVDVKPFCINFCINFSLRMQSLASVFGADSIINFIKNQMSAGKANYNEDYFFEALSEVSILTFYARRGAWKQALYEPPVKKGENNKNPEASFSGDLCCKTVESKGENSVQSFVVNIEVKSPAFPHDTHSREKILIPAVLLTKEGREIVRNSCESCGVKYLDPRVLKIVDFLNSAACKFSIPQRNEFNLLYINWSYRDFPSNSYLEAWSLLTNEINGILTNQKIGKELKVHNDVYEKISAVIVYTESLEGLMFSDFRYVWQKTGAGSRFRMWVLDKKLRKAEWENHSDILFKITGMNPSKQDDCLALLDYKIKGKEDRITACGFGNRITETIRKNALQ